MVTDPAHDEGSTGSVATEDRDESVEQQQTSHVVQRAIILDRARLFFVPVPKAGCTSVLWSLAEMAGLPVSAFADSEGREVTRALAIHDLGRWPPAFRFGQREPEDRDRVLSEDDWLRFTVVRHPFRRLWSAWQSKILLAEPQFTDRYSSQPWFPGELRSGADVIGAWRDFLTALKEDPELLRADVHWAPQVDVLDYKDLSYDHIGHVEQLGETLERVRDHLRATAGLDLPEPPRMNESTLPYDDELFDQDDVKRIAEMYEDDMSAFGYEAPDADKIGGDLPESWMATVDALVPAIEELRNRHQRVADLQQILKARRKQLRETDRRLTRQRRLRREEHQRNNRLVKRLQDATDEIQRMRSSRTWQYTAPIREAGKRFRRIKRRLKGRR